MTWWPIILVVDPSNMLLATWVDKGFEMDTNGNNNLLWNWRRIPKSNLMWGT